MVVELGYFTLKVKDFSRGKRFYGAVFGWTFDGEEGHVKNTKFPVGLSAGGPVDVSFAYFRVPDLDAAVARVEANGGSVQARSAPPSGRNAKCADDQGTVFALWQPAPGFE